MIPIREPVPEGTGSFAYSQVEAVRTTLNHGVRTVSACALANSKGALVGDLTTPIEMGKLEDALALY